MTRQMLMAMAFCAALGPRANAQATRVLLVHGINSDSDTWASTQVFLNSTGNYQANAIHLDWTQHLDDQANVVATRLASSGVSAATILVGHSQGGLVSRLTTRTMPVLGIVTIGSPHAGAPIVDTGSGLEADLAEVALDEGLVAEFLPDFCDSHPDDSTCQPDGDVEIATAGLFDLQFGATVWGLVTLDHDDLRDLSPNSGVVASLEAGSGEEETQKRVSIQVDDDDEASGPFRFLYPDANSADSKASDMETIGFVLEVDGFHIDARIDENDEDEADELLMAEGMEDMGFFLQDFCPIDWNYNIVGSDASDSVVPFDSQLMPNSTTIVFRGASHAQETSETLPIRQALDQMTNRS